MIRGFRRHHSIKVPQIDRHVSPVYKTWASLNLDPTIEADYIHPSHITLSCILMDAEQPRGSEPFKFDSDADRVQVQKKKCRWKRSDISHGVRNLPRPNVKHHRAFRSAAYLENREGGQGLGGRHFTQQGGRSTVVIGGTFRRDFSSLEGTLGWPPTTFSLQTHLRLEGAEQLQRAPSAPKGGMNQCPCLRPWFRYLQTTMSSIGWLEMLIIKDYENKNSFKSVLNKF